MTRLPCFLTRQSYQDQPVVRSLHSPLPDPLLPLAWLKTNTEQISKFKKRACEISIDKACAWSPAQCGSLCSGLPVAGLVSRFDKLLNPALPRGAFRIPPSPQASPWGAGSRHLKRFLRQHSPSAASGAVSVSPPPSSSTVADLM